MLGGGGGGGLQSLSQPRITCCCRLFLCLGLLQEQLNLPRPQEILARLIVLLKHAHYRRQGWEILAFLQAVSVNLHEDVEVRAMQR